MSAYNSERDLVETFLDNLGAYSPWGDISTSSEFFYQRGKTDVVAVGEDGLVLAFEAKLTRWREALQQAYRNTCFAHRSYVVLPKETALLAYRHTVAFNRRHVGICYVEGEEVVILEDAAEVLPLQPWLSAKAKSYAPGRPEAHAAS
jgi:hypothetical protein